MTDADAEQEQARLEQVCYWCSKDADPALRVAAGMGWCGCKREDEDGE